MSCKQKRGNALFFIQLALYQVCHSGILGQWGDGFSPHRVQAPTATKLGKDQLDTGNLHGVERSVQGGNVRRTDHPGLQEQRPEFADFSGETLAQFLVTKLDESGGNFTSRSLPWLAGNVSTVLSEDEFQADFTGFHGVQGKVLGPSFDSSPYFSALLSMRPLVQCDENVMTFTASGKGLTHLLVDREAASPISLLQLPPYCGYSVRRSWNDLEMMMPYDACYITQENDSYVLPMLWWGSPLKLSCPVQLSTPAPSSYPSAPAVFCSTDGMAVQMHGPEEDIPMLGVVVKGGWGSFVSDECAYLVHSKPDEHTFFISYQASCVTIGDGLHLQLVIDAQEYILSCPVNPQFTYIPDPVIPAPDTHPPPPPQPPTEEQIPQLPDYLYYQYLGLQHPQLPQVYPPGPQPVHPTQPTPGGPPGPQHPFPSPEGVQATSAPSLTPTQGSQHKLSELAPGPFQYLPGLYYNPVRIFYPPVTLAPTTVATKTATTTAVRPGTRPPPETQEPTRLPLTRPPAPPSPPNQPVGPQHQVGPLYPPHSPYYHYGPVFYSKHGVPPPYLYYPYYHHHHLYPAHYHPPHALVPQDPEIQTPMTTQKPSTTASATTANNTTLALTTSTTVSTTLLPSIQMPPLQCLLGGMVVFLPFARPDSIQVRDQWKTWLLLSRVSPKCGYMLQIAEGSGVILHSPLPSCHSQSQTPTTISLPLRFLDLSTAQYRTLVPQCPYEMTPETPAPLTPTASPTPPSATVPPVPKPRVICSSHYMTVKLPSAPISGISLKDLKGNQVSLQDAPKHCGYSASKGKDGKVHLTLQLHSHCHMSVQGKTYIISVGYMTINGRWEAQFSCPIIVTDAAKDCNLPGEQRLPCGLAFVSQPQCLSMGCCFSKNPPACYYPMHECTIDHHFVFSVPASITEPRLSPALLVAASNSTCKPQRVTSDHALFKIPMDGCGARRVVVGKMVIYMVELVNKFQGIGLNYGTITRDSPVRFLVECRFQPGSVPTVSYMVKTPTLGPGVQSREMFGVQLRIAKDAQYDSYHPQYHQPLQMLLGKPLYLEVRLLNAPDPSLILLVHFCVAYPRSGNSVWVLLYNGCPNPLDPAPHRAVLSDPLPPSARGQIRRFTISTFQFLPVGEFKDPNEEVYFMCSTEICSPRDGPCVEGCLGQG